MSAPEPRPGVRTAALVLAALAAVLAVPDAPRASSLEPAPWTLTVSPTRVRVGERVGVRVEPRGARRARAPSERYDLYIVLGLAQAASFLTPDGAWSPRRVAWRAGVSLPESALLSSMWPAGPVGEIQLTLLVLRAGADPLSRLDWTFEPVFARVTVRPASPAVVPLTPLLWPALAAVVASALVVRFKRRG